MAEFAIGVGKIPFVITPEPPANSDASRVTFGADREVRFAVVMYGGVSLAIYINGVAQELLSLVRATAPKAARSEDLLLADIELKGAEKVYRELGEYLGHGWPKPGEARSERRCVRTQFVVDVISGTSAGGINGVFLAKALARNQDMEGLKKLWLEEGDFGKLLNDARSLRDLGSTGITRQSPPQSLLNSRRMYRKLLEALAEMGKKGEMAGPSPLVSELDLFVTATDIEGVPLPISLTDAVVYERRYKNVFHFRYAPDPRQPPHDEDFGRDDFHKRTDPFLAFAARCTSSFPFAFEAMCLEDIEDILDHYERYADDDPKGAPDWDQFFRDYLRLGLYDIDKNARREKPTGLPEDAPTVEKARARLRKRFRTRSFGDGGYLDNKPFSHATSMLMRRQADSLVSRKLIYVEPTPEHPEFAPEKRERPDFAENVGAAVLDLPRQETIREDLEHLDERNQMLERIGMFALHADDDFAMAKDEEPLTRKVFCSYDLQDMIERYGVSYGAYHRLNVEEITNLLAGLIARALGYDPCSDEADAIRELTIAWRLRHYDELKTQDRPTENEFLTTFDLRFRLRRLIFLIRRVNELVRTPLDDEPRDLLRTWLKREKARVKKISGEADPAFQAMTWMQENWFTQSSKPPPAQWLLDFQNELKRIKRTTLADGVIAARIAEEQFGKADSRAARKLAEKIDQLNLPWPELAPVLSENDETKERAISDIFTKEREDALQAVADVFRDEWSDERFTSLKLADPQTDVDLANGAIAARRCLHHYYENFNVYDLITFPVQYGTGTGEANVVDVYRVSPEDAKSLMDECPDKPGAIKLAGRAVMSFGAFLDEPWRRNDMLWGRLDGAERLICTLMPLPNKIERSASETEEQKALREAIEKKHAHRSNLIYRAHLGIVNQEIEDGNADAVCRLLSHALAHTQPQEPCGQKLGGFVREVLAQNSSRLNPAQQTTLTTPQDFDRHLPPKRALQYISRSTNITGNMLTGLADKYHSDRGKIVAKWIAGVGSTLWNIIAVAVPQSLGNLFFRHLLGLFYFFAFVLIFVGIFLSNSVKFAGWQLLGVLALVQLLVSGVGAFIRSRRWFMKLVIGAIASPFVALLILGVMHVSVWWQQFKFRRRYELALAIAAAAAVVLFFIVIPAIARSIPNLWRRLRQQLAS